MYNKELRLLGAKEQTDHFLLPVPVSIITKLKKNVESSLTGYKKNKEKFFVKCLLVLSMIKARESIEGHLAAREMSYYINDYMKVVLFLKNNGYINCNNSWSKDSHIAKKYWLLYSDDSTHYSINKSIILPYLKKAFSVKQNAAEKFVNPTGISFSPKLDKNTFVNHYAFFKSSLEGKDQEAIIKYLNTVISNVENGEFNYQLKHTKSHRLYSVFHQLPKALRNYLVDKNGEEMVEVDLTASHPNLLPDVLKLHILPNLESGLSKYSYRLDISNVRRAYDEVEKFRSMFLSSGDFYTSLKTRMRSSKSRDDIKLGYNVYINAPLSNRLSGASKEIGNYFKLAFPNLFQVLELCKVISLKPSVKEQFNISYLLMKMEFEKIHEAVKDFKKQKPDANVITIHDSVLVAKSNVGSLSKALDRTFKRKVHVKSNTKEISRAKAIKDNHIFSTPTIPSMIASFETLLENALKSVNNGKHSLLQMEYLLEGKEMPEELSYI